MNVAPEMMRVWEEMALNVAKSFGDGWVREASSVPRWGAETSPRPPKDLIVGLGRRGLKPKAGGQKRQGCVGRTREGNLVDEADETSESQRADTFVSW